MATVYIQPGTGNGSGTLADPYFYSELTTAQNAATSTGTVDGVVVFTDGDYESSSQVTIGALSASSTVTLEFKSLNKHGATIKYTGTTSAVDFRTGTNSGLFTLKFTDLEIYNYQFYCNNNNLTEIVGVKRILTGVSSGNGIFRGTGTVTIRNSEFYHATTSSTITIWNRANNTTLDECSIFIDASSATATTNTGVGPETYKNTIISSNNGSVFTSDLFGASGMTNCCLNNVFVTSASSGATDCIDGDPQFISTDPANLDLRLRPSSPCIGAGTAS